MMLRKNKTFNDEKPIGDPSLNEKPIDSTAPTVSSETSAKKTIIGENISIKGSIHGKGDLVIQGAVQGNIDLEKHHLTIGPNGKVEAEINADNVTISGRLAGNINARGKVEITRTAEFSGEIKAKRISVEDGAYLKAVIELQRDPQPGSFSKPVAMTSKGSSMEKEKSDLKSTTAKGK
jgi:cytoskeletal protein CcmA (bactofilin family)